MNRHEEAAMRGAMILVGQLAVDGKIDESKVVKEDRSFVEQFKIWLARRETERIEREKKIVLLASLTDEQKQLLGIK